MLLVDDEEPRIEDGSESGRTRTDDDPRLSRADAVPGLPALPLGKRGMQDGRAVAELPEQRPGEHGSQSDLRHEPDRASTRFESCRDGAQIDLGFSGPGHALEKRRQESSLAHRGRNLAQGGLLPGRENHVGPAGRQNRRLLAPALLKAVEKAALEKSAKDRRAHTRRGANLRGGGRPAQRLEIREDLLAAPAPAEQATSLLLFCANGGVSPLGARGSLAPGGDDADPTLLLQTSDRLPLSLH